MTDTIAHYPTTYKPGTLHEPPMLVIAPSARRGPLVPIWFQCVVGGIAGAAFGLLLTL